MNEEEIYEMILNEDVEKYPLVNEIFAIRDSRQKVNNYTICVNGYISLDAINKAIKLRKENEELKAGIISSYEETISELEEQLFDNIPDEKEIIIEKLQKENEELKLKERRIIIGKYGELEIHDVINRTLSNDYIPVQKVKDILNEINKEYIKQEEIFDKHFEKENRDMQDYYIQKEATNIMQELSWIEGKLQELIDRRTKDNEK